MADSQKSKNQRRFNVRTGIQRQTPEQRAAARQAEALREESQKQLQSPQPPQHDTGRRQGAVHRDPRIRNVNTGTVFSSTGAVTSTRPKSTTAASGTEELIQRAEVSENVAVEAERSRRVRIAPTDEEKAAGSTKKLSGRPAKSTGKKDDVIYVSDDEAEGLEGKAVDIEDIDRISISSRDEEEEDGDVVLSYTRRVNSTTKPTLGLRPVRAARDRLSRGDGHNEVFTTAKRKGEAKQTDKDDLALGDKMDLDEEDENVAVTAKQMTPPPDDKAILPSQSPTKRRRKSSTKDTKPQFETMEERAERERYATELRKMRNELSLKPSAQQHEDAYSSNQPLRSLQDGRLYLFQFPPLTPMLLNPSQHHPEIKTEPTTESHPPVPTTASAEPQIKKEDADVKITSTSTSVPEPPKLLTAANTTSLPAGLAGKLNVHQSGKVTLEWGAGAAGGTNMTNLEVKWGAEVDFLQDVVLTAGTEDGERKVWALRQVRNKFVVVPDWCKIYE
jgi:RNA polymerase III RPC4